MKSEGDSHFYLKPSRKLRDGELVPVVCNRPPDIAARRSTLPFLVTCPECLDWIARNYKQAIAQVDAMRRASA